MLLAIDTETTGLDIYHGCRPFMVTGFDGKTNYIWSGKVDPTTRNVYWEPDTLIDLQLTLNSADILLFHNVNFDRRALDSIGINFPMSKVHDTLIASHCICSGDIHGLKELTIKYLNFGDEDESDLHASIVTARDSAPPELAIARQGHPHFPASRKGSKWWKQDMWLDMTLCKRYAIRDVQRTYLLWKCFESQLRRDSMWDMYKLRMQLLPVLYDCQSSGIYFYLDKASKLHTHLTDQRARIQEAMQLLARELAGGAVPYIDPAKDEMLNYFLYTLLDLEVINSTKGGAPSTSADTLDLLEEENIHVTGIQYLKAWRKVDKRIHSIESYTKWCTDSRLHSTLNATGTAWTRQSSSDPNQQNFDKWLEFLFGPPPGYYWFYADVVNIELRIWAYQVGSRPLIEAFETGQSVHMMIANLLYPESITNPSGFKKSQTYTNCKSGTFARIYGGGVKKVEGPNGYGVPNACAIIDKRLPEIGRYFKQLEAKVKRSTHTYGYPSVRTIQGYRLEVDVNQQYIAPNGVIQGSAGLIVQDMMINIVQDPIYKYRNMKLIQQVHDSLKIEIPDHEDSDSTNEWICDRLGQIGAKHIPTCPMEYNIILPTPDELPPEPNYVRAVMISSTLPPEAEDAAAWLLTQPESRVENFFAVAKELYDNRKNYFDEVRRIYKEELAPF